MSPWRDARAELVIAGIAAVVTAVAGFAMAGWPGLAVTASVTAGTALVVIRGLLPRGDADTARAAKAKRTARPVTGYARRRVEVTSAFRRRPAYDMDLRPVLEHLLAARLAERHGVNLYQDPAAARRLFERNRRDAALWPWIAPQTAAPRGRTRRGIPPYTLARLIDRLEHL